MELWIRSQDKLSLTKINSIGIEYDKKLVGYGNVCVKLGEYKTKERALEVLDEIQNILIDYSNISRVVYEMPEE
jgi:hypothetical protein